jgi:hypothetical protein
MGGAYFNSNGASVDQQTPSRSFFSRFSLPIRGSRARHIADFHISPKEPHRQYNAGDHVHGAVNLTVLKPIRLTHLTVTLHGYVRVSKGPAVAERELTTPVLNGRPDAQYHGNGYASLFQDEVVLAGEGRLESAKYQFEFDLQLPKTALPSSIDVRLSLPATDGTLLRTHTLTCLVRARHDILHDHRHPYATDPHVSDNELRPEDFACREDRCWHTGSA